MKSQLIYLFGAITSARDRTGQLSIFSHAFLEFTQLLSAVKCWLLFSAGHLFSWENIVRNILCLCARTKESIDLDTISNIRIIYRMCRNGDKLAHCCLKQTTHFGDIVSGMLFIILAWFVDNIIIWYALFTEFGLHILLGFVANYKDGRERGTKRAHSRASTFRPTQHCVSFPSIHQEKDKKSRLFCRPLKAFFCVVLLSIH